MPRVILLLIILCQATPSQAIIPLELVAEFDLPENAVAWDVQHWMDDSTFGWAAVRNDTVLFTARLGDPIQAVPINESYLDSITHDGPPAYTEILLLGSDSIDSAPEVVVIANVRDWNASQFEDYEYDYYLIVNLESGETSISFRVATYIDMDWLWTDWWAHRSMSAWPPPPLPAVAVRTVYGHHSTYWSPYHTTDDGDFFEHAISDGELLVHADATSYAFFAGDNSGFALVEVENRSGSTGNFRDVEIRRILNSSDTMRTIRSCSSSWTDENDDPVVCLPSGALAATSRTGQRFVICANKVYNAESLALVSELAQGYAPAFSFRSNGMQEDLLWGFQSSNSLKAWSLDFSFEDTTGGFEYATLQLLKGRDGVGEFIAASEQSNAVHIYKPAFSVREMTISASDAAESMTLRWRSFFGAASYEVCRSFLPEGDFCDQDVIAVADTFLILPLINGINKEFFRVRAVFD